MDQAQWAQTEIALLPTEQIALRPSVQQKSLSHMPLETLAASMAREGLREPMTSTRMSCPAVCGSA